MNNHAYQYMCAGRSTGPLGLDQECMQEEPPRQYTYGFEEFENRALFKRILKNILSPGPYSTMAAIIDMRALDVDPRTYIGVHSIALQAAKSERQVERDLKTLEDMELLRTYPDMAPVKGTMRAVMRKDFSGLYTFAYEYLLWENSTEFAMYPPKRKFAELVRKDHGLYKKLVRFENYRLVLETKKNKFKKEDKDTVRGEAKNNRQLLHVSSSTVSSLSSYETHNSNYLDSLDSNLTQDLNVIQEDSPFTRSSGGEYPQSERGTHEGEIVGGSEGSESFSIPPVAQGNISQREAEPKVSRKVPQTAKEISAQQKSKALIESVLTEEDRKAHTPKQERRNKWLESEELRKRCKTITNLYSHIVERLNDQNEKSTTTLLCKLFEESGMDEESFIAHIDYARQKVLSIPADKIRKRGIDGKPNRTPLFLQILKDAIKRGIEACQEDDRHADEVRNMFKVVEQEKAQEPAPEIDYEELDKVVVELGQELEERHQIREEIMGEIFPSDSGNELQISQPQKPVEQNQAQAVELPTVKIITPDEWHSAKVAIKAATGKMILPNSGCAKCGCKLGAVIIGHDPYCVECCSTIPGWTQEMYRKVDEIIGQLYRGEAV